MGTVAREVHRGRPDPDQVVPRGRADGCVRLPSGSGRLRSRRLRRRPAGAHPEGVDTSRMTSITAPFALPLVFLAFLFTVGGTWHRTGPERWVAVAALACVCDLALTYAARSRFSAGWYAGRSLTHRRHRGRPGRDAGVVPPAQGPGGPGCTPRPPDPPAEPRGALAALEMMILQARRAGTPLGVIALDLDWFKAVNDQAGHEAGDRVLVDVGQVLTSCSRGGDVAARPWRRGVPGHPAQHRPGGRVDRGGAAAQPDLDAGRSSGHGDRLGQPGGDGSRAGGRRSGRCAPTCGSGAVRREAQRQEPRREQVRGQPRDVVRTGSVW